MATIGDSLPPEVLEHLLKLQGQLPVAADPATDTAQAIVDAASQPGNSAAQSAQVFENAGMIPGKSAAESAEILADAPSSTIPANQQLVPSNSVPMGQSVDPAAPGFEKGGLPSAVENAGAQGAEAVTAPEIGGLPAVIEQGAASSGAGDGIGSKFLSALEGAPGLATGVAGAVVGHLADPPSAGASQSSADGPIPSLPGYSAKGDMIEKSGPEYTSPIGPTPDDADKARDIAQVVGPSVASTPEIAQAAAAVASSKSKLDPILDQYFKDKQDLADAQKQAFRNQQASSIGRVGATLAHALAGAKGDVDSKPFDELDAQSQQPVADMQARQAYGAKSLQDLQARIQTQDAAAGADPNSDESTQLRAIYRPLYEKAGLDPKVLDNVGATFMRTYAQQPLEAIDKMKSQETQKAIQLELTRARLEQAQQNRQTTAYNATVQQLETGRGQPVVQKAENDIYAAQKANTLVAMAPGGDPNNLSESQVHMLYNDIGKIASGGQPQQSELNFITPSTLVGKMSKVYSDFKNAPTAANAGAFIRQAKQYADGLTKDAQNVITDRYSRVIGSKASQFSPDQVATLKTQYQDRFKQIANQGLNPKSSQALPPLNPGEVRRSTSDGKTAIFDSGTEQFLRYE